MSLPLGVILPFSAAYDVLTGVGITAGVSEQHCRRVGNLSSLTAVRELHQSTAVQALHQVPARGWLAKHPVYSNTVGRGVEPVAG